MTMCEIVIIDVAAATVTVGWRAPCITILFFIFYFYQQLRWLGGVVIRASDL